MNKTLLQILVDELPTMGGWPKNAKCAVRVLSGAVRFTDAPIEVVNRGHLFGTHHTFFIEHYLKVDAPILIQEHTVIVTHEQYEQELNKAC